MHRPPHNPHSQNRGHQQHQQRNDRQDQGQSHNIGQHPQYRHPHPGHRPNDFTISDVLTQCIDSVMHDPTPQHLQNAMTTQADFAALLRPKPLNSKQNPKQAAMAAHIQSQHQNPKQAAMAAHVQSQQSQKHAEQSYPTYPGPHMDNQQMQMQQQNPGNHGNQQQNPGNHGNQQQNPGNHNNQQRQQDPEFPDFTRSDEDMDQSGRHGVQLQTNQNPPPPDFRRQQVGNGRLNMNQSVVDVDPNTARVREAYQDELMNTPWSGQNLSLTMRQTEPAGDSDTESHGNPFAALQMPMVSESSPPVQEKRGTDSPVDTVDETIAAIVAESAMMNKSPEGEEETEKTKGKGKGKGRKGKKAKKKALIDGEKKEKRKLEFGPDYKKHPRGKPLNADARQICLNVREYFRKLRPYWAQDKYDDLTAECCGVSSTTVRRIKQEKRKTGTLKSMGKTRPGARGKSTRLQIYDGQILHGIQKKVEDYTAVSGVQPTFKEIRSMLNDDITLPNFTKSTLRRLLLDLDVKFKHRTGQCKHPECKAHKDNKEKGEKHVCKKKLSPGPKPPPPTQVQQREEPSHAGPSFLRAPPDHLPLYPHDTYTPPASATLSFGGPHTSMGTAVGQYASPISTPAVFPQHRSFLSL